MSPDPVEDSRELIKEEGFTFRLVSDPDRKVIKRFGVDDPANETAWPSVVVTHEKHVVFRHISESYDRRATVAQLKAAVSGVARPATDQQPSRPTGQQATLKSPSPSRVD